MEILQVALTGCVTHETTTPFRVELARGQRGGYGWTIEVKGNDLDAVLDKLRHLDDALRDRYLTEGPQ